MYKIMLVDDMEIFRRKIKRMKIWKQNIPFIITDEAGDGSEALDKLRKKRVDVVITDIKMPKVDGIELLKVIQQEKLAECVILLSDFTEYEYAREGMILGAFDYIGKSLSESEFMNILVRLEKKLIKKTNRVNENQNIDIMKELEIIADYIVHGDIRAVQIIKIAYENRYQLLGYLDQTKLILKMKFVWNCLIDKILAACPWITLYCTFEIYMKDNFLLESAEELIQLIIRYTQKMVYIFQTYMCSYDDLLIRNTCYYILIHLNEQLAVTDIAKKMFVSKSHLSEQFKEKTGMTLVKYITLSKMERAKILVKTTDFRNYQIANMLGYQYTDYFSKVFHKYTGMSLAEYRRHGDID